MKPEPLVRDIHAHGLNTSTQHGKEEEGKAGGEGELRGEKGGQGGREGDRKRSEREVRSPRASTSARGHCRGQVSKPEELVGLWKKAPEPAQHLHRGEEL